MRLRRALLALVALVVMGVWVAAAVASPTPAMVEEPSLEAQTDTSGVIEQVRARFALSNTVARPKGVKHAVTVTIAGRLASSRPAHHGGTRWTATLLGENGTGLKIGRLYTVVVTACGSRHCATRRFRERLQTQR
jgi:hypothetical protein